MKRETAYGQAATGNYIRMPFNRCNLGSEQAGSMTWCWAPWARRRNDTARSARSGLIPICPGCRSLANARAAEGVRHYPKLAQLAGASRSDQG